MTTVLFVIAVVVGMIVAEARVSRRNEGRLLEAGGRIPPGDVYQWLATSYPVAILLMGAEGVWRSTGTGAGIDVPGVFGLEFEPSWFASGLLLFGASKALKYWAIWALGERWTFRVVVLPGVPLVTRGPYRYVAHPNYVAVIGELAGTAMMVGALMTGPVMLAVVGAAIRARVRFEGGQIRRAAGFDRSS